MTRGEVYWKLLEALEGRDVSIRVNKHLFEVFAAEYLPQEICLVELIVREIGGDHERYYIHNRLPPIGEGKYLSLGVGEETKVVDTIRDHVDKLLGHVHDDVGNTFMEIKQQMDGTRILCKIHALYMEVCYLPQKLHEECAPVVVCRIQWDIDEENFRVSYPMDQESQTSVFEKDAVHTLVTDTWSRLNIAGIVE